MGLARDRDLLSGLVLAALGVLVLSQALQWAYIGPDGPGPGFFPVWYGVLMIALSLYLVLKSAVKPDPDARAPVDWHGTGRALLTWALFAGSVALMEPFGFPASFGLLVLLIVWLVMGKPLLVGLATAVAMTLGFWLLFSLALGLSLPPGTVWQPLARMLGIG